MVIITDIRHRVSDMCPNLEGGHVRELLLKTSLSFHKINRRSANYPWL